MRIPGSAVHWPPAQGATEIKGGCFVMRTLIKAVGFAAILAGLAIASPRLEAGQVDNAVREGAGVVTRLSANASAVTYWVSQADGWHVVTTVDTVFDPESDSGKHAVVRFSAVLLPGQSQVISVPFALGEPQQGLRIRRIGDR